MTAKTIAKIPYGAEVQLISERQEWGDVGWMRGYWAQVRHEGKTGYVYSPYLSALPLPDLSNDESTCEQVITGFEFFLSRYIRDHLRPEGGERILYETGPNVEEFTQRVSFQWYENHVQVISISYYEASSTALRVPGMDIFQAFAFLETLLKPCPGATELTRNPKFIKDDSGDIIEIRDPEFDGYHFRIRQINPGTAEIQMSSGV